jgi:hypothetical protein
MHTGELDELCGNKDGVTARHARREFCSHRHDEFLQIFARFSSVVRYRYLL